MNCDTNAIGNEFISQYLNLQEINQSILNANYDNAITREILSRHINHSCFGVPGINLERKAESDHAQIIFGTAVFGITTLLSSVAIAVPIAVLSYTLYGSSVINSVYSNLSLNKDVIVKAAEFFLDNKECNSYSTHLFSRITKKENLSNQELLKIYSRLFSAYYDQLSNIPDFIPTADTNSKSESTTESKEKRDINVELNINSKNEESLLIINDELLNNKEIMNEYCTVKGSVTEIELLSTISKLEKYIQDDIEFHNHNLDNIDTIILPSLRKALDFQSSTIDGLT